MDARRSPSPAVALGLLYLVVVGPFVQEYTAQPASRYALTAAVVERGTIRLDEYAHVLGIDRVERDGHLYSDKAPGQPFLAAPVFAAGRAVGVEPADRFRRHENLGVWWVTLWSSVIPVSVLVGLVHASLRPRAGAVVAAVAVGFGTLLLPFGSELYGHALAAALGFAAWRLVDRASTTGQAGVAGLVAALAVTVEYPMVIVAAVGAAVLAARRAWRQLGAYALAGVPFAVALGAYHAAAFGSAFTSSYSEKGDGGTPAVTGLPDPVQAIEVLFGTRGLFLFTPIALVGVVGLARLAARPGSQRVAAVVSLVVFGGFLLLQAGWVNPWGGEMPGPRYLIPALPFLGLGIAEMWAPATRRAVVGALGFSVATMVFPLVTLHLVPDGGATVAAHIRHLAGGELTPTVFTIVAGPVGWVLHLGLAVLAGVVVRNSLRSAPPSGPVAASAPAVVGSGGPA